ncbi:uncharacterized protein FOMMEDRAFT_88353 [Fomitiporia mediterranea MF3/22]|uniref:uncharacterized protein n=1 Tax=Fomitiporia mediterranea (strain MF3/22) TaxID=694068 RepID=UPI0004407E13|nr:uncharacterized protein FOMMEDRAFT_88353 [Fomitiporia mediterranea MF3/22]EJD01656.1 hypothetical protein FOMMEDRAFT_88353 [Fomitiporia mediterranea MF3/22]
MQDYEPFNAPDADVVLQTCDGVRFGVYRRILAEASPFFRDMFSLPQSGTEEGGTVPVVEVSETAEVMGTLLKLVYPGVGPEIKTLDEVSMVLGAAMKYDMLRAIETLRRLLITPSFVEKEPTRVYAIACRYDLESEARVASSYTLRINVLDGPLSDDLKYITAWSYHRLLDLHRRRADAALRVLESAVLEDVKCMQCNSAHYGSLCPPRWWTEFVGKAKEELRARPTTDVVFSMAFLAASGRTGCQRCSGSILESYAFLEGLKKRIDELPAMI